MAMPKSLTRVPMSHADTAWFRMEEPANRMMINGILAFGETVDADRLRAVIEHRLLRYDRFRQRVVGQGKVFRNPRWEDDPAFDLEHHLKTTSLPEPAGKAELQDLVSTLMSESLDFDRPLWQFHLVNDYEGGSALIVRLHHCIADGIALIHVLLSLTDDAPDADPAAAREPSEGDGVMVTGSVRRAVVQPGDGFGKKVGRLLALGGKCCTAAGRLIGRWPDPDTIFKGTLVREKRAAWSRRIPLDQVKAIGKAIGGTVNDVLLTAMTGALRRYMVRQGEEPERRLSFRAAIPVNLRSPREPFSDLGNRFGLVFLSLPVGIEDPLDRLRVLRRNMEKLKSTPEAAVAFGILQGLGAVPMLMQRALVEFLAWKITAVATNVPGPRKQLYMAGAPLRAIVPWVPQAGRAGLGISIFSYHGGVWLGMATDANLVPEPEAIIDSFYEEFDALLGCVPHERLPEAGEGAARSGDALATSAKNMAENRQAGRKQPQPKQ